MKNQIIELVLKGNPKSTQAIYRFTCRGRFATMYMSKAGKDLKANYQLQLMAQYKKKVLTKEIEMKLVFFHGDKRVRDIDNFNKLILDSMSGIVYRDDSQIKKLLIEMDYDKNNPRVEIKIK